ncbi:MAG: hypothetical protein IKJ24_04320 [Clostridia bacterium]|nr:hypothetical protein [Clostridia bacterium]
MKKEYTHPLFHLITIDSQDILTKSKDNNGLIDGGASGEEVTLPSIGDWMNE